MVKLYKTLAKSGLAMAGLTALSLAAAGTASASCASGSLYCNANSWTSAGTSYVSAPASTYSTRYGDAGSYSAASDYSYSSTSSISAPAGMVKVDCPYTVDVPEGGRVLDCFAVAQPKPAPVTTYQPVYNTVQRAYQVVRPVVYVDYPVPVAVPNTCGPIYSPNSRYGDWYGGYNRGGCR